MCVWGGVKVRYGTGGEGAVLPTPGGGLGGSTLGSLADSSSLCSLLNRTNSYSVNLNLKNDGLKGTVDLIFIPIKTRFNY